MNNQHVIVHILHLHMRWPLWQVALAEVKDDCQDIDVPNVVAPQVKGLLARVEDVSKKLVFSTELAPRWGQFLPLVEVGVVWKSAHHRIEGKLEAPLWEA